MGRCVWRGEVLSSLSGSEGSAGFEQENIGVCLGVYVSKCPCVCGCVCILMCMCVRLRVPMCICVCACVCVPGRFAAHRLLMTPLVSDHRLIRPAVGLRPVAFHQWAVRPVEQGLCECRETTTQFVTEFDLNTFTVAGWGGLLTVAD